MSPGLPTRTRVIILAKAPQPGLSKTRLAPALGLEGAARLADRFLRETVAMATHSGVGPVELCAAPDLEHPVWLELQQRHGCALSVQGPGDLGSRMARAMQHALGMQPAALLIGTDAPALDAPMLQAAALALQQNDAVFVPTADGGYALIGLRRFDPRLFDGIAWSTSAVMQATRQALSVAGMSHAELPMIHDVDEPADLVHVPAAWLEAAGSEGAPWTLSPNVP